MEERIISIQNLSATPITIEGVLLNQNSIMYPTIGFWLTDAWKPLTMLTTLRVSLTTGVSYDLLTRTNDYANAFSRTANYVNENYLILLEIEKLQGQITTTGNSITTITEFSLPNGVHNIAYMIKGFSSASGNGIGEKCFCTIKVFNNVYSLISTLTQDRKSNFGATVRSSVDVTANSFRIRVTGQNATTILWNLKIIDK